MPYPNFHVGRLHDPAKYKSFATKELAPGIMGVLGIKKEGGSELQAVRFQKGKFTPAEAKAWLKEHNMKPILFEPAEEKKD